MGGIDFERPDTMNNPTTAAYVARHITHTAFRITNAAYAMYRTTARPTVDVANR